MVKVSDFGLTRNIGEEKFYQMDDQCKELPMRWMSIEALEQNIFSVQSDVVCTYNVLLIKKPKTSNAHNKNTFYTKK